MVSRSRKGGVRFICVVLYLAGCSLLVPFDPDCGTLEMRGVSDVFGVMKSIAGKAVFLFLVVVI